MSSSQQSSIPGFAPSISFFEAIPAPIKGMLSSPSGLAMLGILIFLFIINLNRRQPKNILARGRLGGNAERRAALKLALKQIENPQKEEITLYIGTPKGRRIITDHKGQKILYLPEDPKTIYLPNAQENILYIGRSGSGKSFSAGYPLVMSAIQQGFSVFYYDFKGHENPSPSDKIIGYAAKYGYKISVLAPGYPESCTCNILDFLKDSTDAENAYQLASVLNNNFQLSSGGGSNEFFDRAGNQLIQAILMLTKTCSPSELQDIATCHYLLSTQNLGARLEEIEDSLSPYILAAFDNYLSSCGSPETAASIATTASLMFSKFMNPNVLATFGGQTTLPLDVDGKHLIVFKMDPQQKDVVAPLLAATINMMVNRNVFRLRKNPLILSLDEVNTIRIPMLVHWLNQNRSSKFSALLGVQSIGFLEEVYGEKVVNGILGGCGTQLIFQLNDKQSAEYYSALLGNEEIKYKQSSHSRGKEGTNRSSSEQRQTRPVVEIQELEQFPRGKCLILNSGYGNLKKEIRIPVIQQIQIPAHDLTALKEGAAALPLIRENLIKNHRASPPTPHQLLARKIAASRILSSTLVREQGNRVSQAILRKY